MKVRSVLVSDELDNSTEAGKARSQIIQRFASDLSVLMKCPADVVFVRRISDLLVQKALSPEQRRGLLEDDQKKYANVMRNFDRPGQLYVKLGWPIEEITKLINKENSFEALVIGTRSLKGIERFFLGSVAEEVIRNVKRPVFVLGPSVQKDDRPLVDSEKLNFVVATDLTKRCRAIETYAVSMAKKTGAKVTLYFNLAETLETAAKFGYGAGEMLPSLDTVLADIKKDAITSMEKKVARLKEKGIQCEAHIEVKNTNVQESLLSYCEGKSLLFMGHQTHGFVASTILGSNARSMIMHSKVPVVIVRS